MSWQEWIVIFAALAAGGLTKGLTGMGLPMVAIPIMAAFLGVERAVLIMIVPTVVLNVWMSWVNRDCSHDMPEIWRLLLPGLPGAALGASILYLTPNQWLATGLALWICFYLVVRLMRPDMSLSMPARLRVAPIAGFGSGAMQAATGICAPIIASYIDALGLTPRSYVFAISTAFAAFAGSHFLVLLALQAYSVDQLIESSIALIPGLLAMRPGMWLREIVEPSVFTRVIRVILVIMAVRLIYGAWFSG
ncbi:MAG: sulfite exporter TauE/SafE family protein [Gammaproteobacteria bacterium]|nr:sulfite exporter TauE/SafE family protein [Gammaproteobacteria bacterium]MDH3505968.1 sulfite exporter TauE/SafE family protein [Gammaproteobacteria bacterium]